MHTKEITFDKENENKVFPLMARYTSDSERLGSTKDGEIYTVTFNSPENYKNFFHECGDFLLYHNQ